MTSPGRRLHETIEAPGILAMPGFTTGSSLPSARQLGDMGRAVITCPRILTAAAIEDVQNAPDALRRSLDGGEVFGRPNGSSRSTRSTI